MKMAQIQRIWRYAAAPSGGRRKEISLFSMFPAISKYAHHRGASLYGGSLKHLKSVAAPEEEKPLTISGKK